MPGSETRCELGRMEQGTWVVTVLERPFGQEGWKILHQFDMTPAVNRLLAAVPRASGLSPADLFGQAMEIPDASASEG